MSCRTTADPAVCCRASLSGEEVESIIGRNLPTGTG